MSAEQSIYVVAIIPARYASTRLPAKPLLDFCGKPMIQHVYDRAKEATLVNDVIVATDHERIADVVRGFGGKVMMTPSSLQSGSDRIAYAASTLATAEIIVNVQGDEPLIVPRMIDEAVKPLIDDGDIPVGTLIKKITTAEELSNPNVVKVVLDAKGFALYFSRAPIPYTRDGMKSSDWNTEHVHYKHIGLYVFRKEFLRLFSTWGQSRLEQIEKLEQLRIIENGYRIKTTVTMYDTMPVDTMEDVDRVRSIMKTTSAVHHG